MTDTSTGLVWQRDGLGSRDCLLSPYCTETEAVAYCAGLSLDGSGWRLPTYTELNSILDTTVAYPPLINKAAFPNTPAEDFMTSSLPCSGNCGTSYYIDVNFSAGDNTADYNGNADCRVRCVLVLWPIAPMIVSATIVKSDPSTGTGRRRPERSGSPSCILMQ